MRPSLPFLYPSVSCTPCTRVTHLSLTAKVMFNVAVQSPRLIPALLLPPADPAGAKPRRDHRFLDRVSRHEVPKTPGKRIPREIYDPARVSHLPVCQSVRHPSGVVGLGGSVGNPESSGLRPSTSGLKNEHPCRGATQPGDPHPWGYGGTQVNRWHDGTHKGGIGPYSSR